MKKRVFSGARPTGRQHIGNYLGAIQNYVKLQEDYECVYCVVDIHSLTTLEDTSNLSENTLEMVIDWLAAGLDPEKSIIFVQSHVPQVAELHAYLSMITPLGWLLRVPTYKEKVRQQPQNVNYGLVGYPVLMTADIVLYKSEIVPVGEDQLPHLELAREIVRRFNNIYRPIFPEPQGMLTQFPLVVGLDGSQKMSKSLNNHLELSLSPEETLVKVKSAVTDPGRKYRSDPGNPDICNIFQLHKFFTSGGIDEISIDCKSAKIGCVDCKVNLATNINVNLSPFRARRRELVGNPDYIKNVLADGAFRASTIAEKTVEEVRESIGFLDRQELGIHAP